MKQTRLYYASVTLMLLLMLALAPIAGCAKPMAQAVAADQTYTSTLRVLSAARRNGAISDAQYAQIEKYRVPANTALDTLETAAVSGDANKFQTALAAYNAAIDALLAQAERKQP